MKLTLVVASFTASALAQSVFNPVNSPNASYLLSLPVNAQDLFNVSMNWMDQFYDSAAGYLHDVSSSTALRHNTRSSGWYAVGLLARNQGSDVEEALKIITNIIAGQYKDPAKQWCVTTLGRHD